MKRGVLASLTCLLLVGCAASGPTPITSPQPTSTLAAQPTNTPAHSPSATSTPLATPTSGVAPSPTRPLPGWTERADVASGPSPREDHTWTLNGDGQVAYLFGGGTADGPSNELWAFDLVRDEWTQLHPSGEGPQPRFGHTATWVPGYGLAVWSGQGRDFFDDIWAYDPLIDAWHQLPSIGAVPEARYGSCASLGPDERLWISHGFTRDDGRFADTRAYDFAIGEWEDMTPAGDRPVERCLHDCYWSEDGRLILYGGQTTGVAALGDVWAFDPDAATWTEGPESAAPPRQLYALGTLWQMGSALVFGGGSLDRGYLSDVWGIHSSTQEMYPVQFAGTPPPARSGATLLFDPRRNRFLLFGGQNDSGHLGDLWDVVGPPVDAVNVVPRA